MDVLSFDAKNCDSFREGPSISDRANAVIFGGSIIVPEEHDSLGLIKVGYGSILGDRQDRVSAKVFGFDGMEMNDDARQWSESSPKNLQLRLSPEEVAYLVYDEEVLDVSEGGRMLDKKELWSRLRALGGKQFIRRLAVYRKLKQLGWCVRSGLTYGCHYLIYRVHPEEFHASAAVLIEDELQQTHFCALNRVLTNVRKAIIVASLSFPSSTTFDSPDSLDLIDVKMVTSTSFFLNKNGAALNNSARIDGV